MEHLPDFVTFFVFLVTLHCGCPQGKIVAEKDCPILQHPFMVSLRIKSNNMENMCGGTLVERNWVLTSAHCLAQLKVNDMVVMGGTGTTHMSEAAQFYSHPKFNFSSGIHDIGLIRLKHPLELPLVKLPSRYERNLLAICPVVSVMGWGSQFRNPVSTPEPYNPRLRCTNLLLVEGIDCMGFMMDFEGQVCAMGTEQSEQSNSSNSCVGDSRGALMCGNVQYGVTSHGVDDFCGRPNAPSVYTRVDAYLGFIASTRRELSAPTKFTAPVTTRKKQYKIKNMNTSDATCRCHHLSVLFVIVMCILRYLVYW